MLLSHINVYSNLFSYVYQQQQQYRGGSDRGTSAVVASSDEGIVVLPHYIQFNSLLITVTLFISRHINITQNS